MLQNELKPLVSYQQNVTVGSGALFWHAMFI